MMSQHQHRTWNGNPPKDPTSIPAACVFCEKGFPTEPTLHHHIVQHIGEQWDNNFDGATAEFRPQSGSDSNSNVPQRRLQSNSSKRYQCSICCKRFSRSEHVTRHMRIHTREKSYECENFSCGKRFSRKDDLKRHLLLHSERKSYPCSMCHKTFSQPTNLQRHARAHKDIKLYQCQICPKAFSQAGGLAHHIRAHTTEKPDKCSICLKAFVHSSHVKRHAETVHKRIMPCLHYENKLEKIENVA